ncbi:hypothetical protein [Verrucomicrobium sp. BvORR106]|uniref:hypothetical protein n=1 Tax=Verrucomicrobium sp. BvORR106 TaxID=1403819 RepID=UPI000AEBD8BB|nr:hypothetical protein [Verrucomicrobium sp. BvORR106]
MPAVPDVDVVMTMAATEALLNAWTTMVMVTMPVAVTMADGLNLMSGLTMAVIVTFTC